MSLVIGVPRESFPGEKRVATVPEVVEKLIKLGFSVAVQSGAGAQASFSDDSYLAAGATIVKPNRLEAFLAAALPLYYSRFTGRGLVLAVG